MSIVFLSYSRKDHFFAELAQVMLAREKIELWKDAGQLRPGADWRQGIEKAISDSLAVLVALSADSAGSSYVTFEWAYALGKGKAIIPMMLNDCTIHPKLETIQYLDFSIPGALPWESLIALIREIETDVESPGPADEPNRGVVPVGPDDGIAKAILAYLNQRGLQMVSFDRVRQSLDKDLTDERLTDIIAKNSNLFRRARLRGDRPGIAKLIP